ncbi:helix-turn-helix domain-containing protein [Eubacteriales bacterium OttesenSCG-928-G02]|nr:helix-turn-helix domain-containing protein [Eubacteriales bacterium OttesenSCG-928-G02]
MSGNNIERVGRRIQKLREGNNMTQAALAKEMGVSRETINHWESDTREIKATQLLKLSELFDVTCDFILRGVQTENVNIHKKTGLSEKAIELLITAKQEKDAFIKNHNPNKYYFSDVLNILLENINHFPEIYNLFHSLLNKDFSQNITELDFENECNDKDPNGLMELIHKHGTILLGDNYRSHIQELLLYVFKLIIHDIAAVFNPSYYELNSAPRFNGEIFTYSRVSSPYTLIKNMNDSIDCLQNKNKAGEQNAEHNEKK